MWVELQPCSAPGVLLSVVGWTVMYPLSLTLNLSFVFSSNGQSYSSLLSKSMSLLSL